MLGLLQRPKDMIFRILLSVSAFVVLSFAQTHAEEITLYSHRHYEADKALYKQFTEETGIEVNVVRAGADELIERLKAEGENSPADVLITVDAGRLERAKVANLLQPIDSAMLTERIPENYRDRDNQWFGVSMRARILAYSPDRVDASELGSYEDLADPKWRGRLLSRSSMNIYNLSLMASIIAEHGADAARD